MLLIWQQWLCERHKSASVSVSMETDLYLKQKKNKKKIITYSQVLDENRKYFLSFYIIVFVNRLKMSYHSCIKYRYCTRLLKYSIFQLKMYLETKTLTIYMLTFLLEPHWWSNGQHGYLKLGRQIVGQRSGQSKDYTIGICCLHAKHTALRSKSKDWLAQNIIRIMHPREAKCLPTDLFQ